MSLESQLKPIWMLIAVLNHKPSLRAWVIGQESEKRGWEGEVRVVSVREVSGQKNLV